MTDRFATVPAQARDFQGQRAGIVTRVAAAAVDFLIVIVAIGVIYGGIAGVTFIIHPRSFHWPSNIGWSIPVVYLVLLTAYLAFSWAGTGRTYGAALLGVRVVNHKGATMRLSGAILRAVLCVVFPIGLLWVAISSANRSIQDVIFRTSVIYDWSPRTELESSGQKTRVLPGT
jgi:uncharacterized RDD family membrane protein YckC